MCVCACVFVTEREKERESERGGYGSQNGLWAAASMPGSVWLDFNFGQLQENSDLKSVHQVTSLRQSKTIEVHASQIPFGTP